MDAARIPRVIGQTLGSYTIQRELGRGGMGAVFVGTHALLGRQAAVKVLLPELSRHHDIVQRFFNEARAATAVKHPGIVEIYDFGYSHDGSAFIVMEFLEGEALTSRLRRFGRVAPAFALAIGRQVAGALGAAHRAGIVHRDLKPDNVFLVPDAEIALGERIKLLDFGIAKLAGDGGGGGPAAGMARTSTGAIMGTPYYMSPEQCRGAGQVDHRSDLYSLGCMLYEMIGGRVPFVGEGAGDIIAAHLMTPVPPLRELAPDVPPQVEAMIARLLAKRPDDRPASADHAAQELAQVAATLGSAASPSAGPFAATAAAPTPAAFTAVAPAPTGPSPAPTTPTPSPTAAAPGAPTTLGGAAHARDATTPPQAARPRRAALWLGLAAAGAAAAAIVAVVALSGDRTSPRAAAGATPADAALAVPEADAGAATTDLARLLADARNAVTTEVWPLAGKLARAALAIDPDSAEAQAIAAQADREAPAAAAAQKVATAKADKDYAAAVAAFAEIPDDSIYKERVAPLLDELRDAYFGEIGPKLDKLLAARDCAGAAFFASNF